MRTKKKFFVILCTCSLLIAACSVVYAAVLSDSYLYENGMVMNYTLGEERILWDSAATAVTTTDYSAVCFTSLFGYNGSGTVVDSMIKRQSFFSELVMNKNASYYKSFHSLLDGNMNPYGPNRSLSTE